MFGRFVVISHVIYVGTIPSQLPNLGRDMKKPSGPSGAAEDSTGLLITSALPFGNWYQLFPCHDLCAKIFS